MIFWAKRKFDGVSDLPHLSYEIANKWTGLVVGWSGEVRSGNVAIGKQEKHLGNLFNTKSVEQKTD